MKELSLRKEPSRALCLVCVLGLVIVAQAAQPVRPQDDLHQFANAEWMQSHPLSAERVTASASTELVDQVELDLRRLIEDLEADPSASKRADVQQIVYLYRSVTNQAEVEQRGLSPVRADLDRIDAIATTRELAAVAGYLSSIAAGGPFEAQVSTDAEQLSVPIVRVLQGGTMLPDRTYYLSADPAMVSARQGYRAYLEQVFRLAGRADASGDASAVVALEIRLAEAQWPPERRPSPGDPSSAVPFLRLGKSFPGFDWQAWAEPQGIHHAPNVVMSQPSFFQAFAAMVPELPLSTWRAWLAARYLTAMSPYLPSALAMARFEYFGRALTGQQEPRPPWKRGVSMVSEFLGDAIGRRYVERYLSSGSRAQVQAIAREVLAAYRDEIVTASWMSPASRREARSRLSTLNLRIGYPDRWRQYNGLELRPDDLVGNVRRARAFDSRYRMERLSTRADPREWLMTPQTVNAYYGPAQHEIVVTAGILQPPYFSADEDEAQNYGAIGAIIGHEISHALNLQEFRDGIRSLEEQVGRFEVLPGIRPNTALVLPETLADLSGLSIAYRAWQRSVKGRRSPPQDSRLAAQGFFLGWARLWRVQSRPEFVRYQIGTSAYAPAELRANGIVQHLDAFYEAFDVKPGDRLYREPAARARMW